MAIFEGCSQGFWSTRLDAWGATGFTTDTLFFDVFSRVVTDPDLTLLEAINLTGPGVPVNVHQLTIQAVAALLNAAHPDVNYPLTVAKVIEEFQEAFDTGDSEQINDQKDRFENFNADLICPLPGTPSV